MPVYTFMMTAVTAALFIAGLLLRAGQYGWLHGFNFSAHRDNKQYSKFLGTCVLGLGLVTLVSGFVYLPLGTVPAVVVLAVGVLAAFVIMAKNAGKYY